MIEVLGNSLLECRTSKQADDAPVLESTRPIYARDSR